VSPVQIDEVCVNKAVGTGTVDNITVSVIEQVPLLAVTTKVVVITDPELFTRVTVGFEISGLLIPVVGNHE
jgi:hypothetical protein